MQRHGIVSRNHNTAQLPPSERPSGLRQTITALARSFQLRIPQPPAPRGSRDRACSQDSLSPPWANESWSFFFWGGCCHSAARWREPEISFQYVRNAGPAPSGASPNDGANNEVMEVSEATCRPRRASGLVCRDCHPGHRPPRHRRPRGKYFPAARSSCRNCRSSHLS